MTERDDHHESKADLQCLNVRSSSSSEGEEMLVVMINDSNLCEAKKMVDGDDQTISRSTLLKPLRERRNFVLSPLTTLDTRVLHENVLLECKEKELYFKTKPSRRGNKIEEILSLFERNTHINE